MLAIDKAFGYARKLLTEQKKLVFIITIVISILLLFIGISYIINKIDINKAHAFSLVENNNVEIKITKNETADYFKGLFSKNELYSILDDIKPNDYSIGYNLFTNDDFLYWQFLESDDFYDYYSFDNWNVPHDYVYITLNNAFDYSYIGVVPKREKEIMINNYLADYMIKLGVWDMNENNYFPKSYKDIINDKIPLNINGNEMIITAIYNVDYEIDKEDFMTFEDQDFLVKNLYKIYTSDEFLNAYSEEHKLVRSLYIQDYRLDKNTYILSTYQNSLTLDTAYSKIFESMGLILAKIKPFISYIYIISIIFIITLLYVFNSLTFKKQLNTIGIIRMLGGSKKDILKILVFENAFIGIWSYLLGIVNINFFILGFNYFISNENQFRIDLLSNNIEIYFYLLLIVFSSLLLFATVNILKLSKNNIIKLF